VTSAGIDDIPGAPKVVWSGGTPKIPQDVVRLDPKHLTIGWVSLRHATWRDAYTTRVL
jgi:hypothetical protein